MRSLGFLFFLLTQTALASLSATDPAWLRLGYWEGSSGSYKSAARGDFFLSPDGPHSPEAELAQTRKAFTESLHKKPPLADDDAICRFPARFRLLGPELGVRGDKALELCPRFATWFKQVNAQGATVLFASAFINSPSSMYGHTMLRLGRAGKTEGQVLLDNVVSFAADPGNSDGLAYMILGLTGGFPGSFSMAPFYMKVHEYSNVENREFWEYELNLSQPEVDFLVSHIWEQRQSNFAYYFLKRNCSYYLLRLLEAIKPDENFVERFGGWSIPVDTIRVLDQAGLIRKRHFRPSRWEKVLALRNSLTSSERGLAAKLAKGEDASLNHLSPTRKAQVLDTAYEYFRYRNAITNALTPAQKQIETKLLGERSQVQDPSVSAAILASPPELGHRTQRLSLFGGSLKTPAGEHQGFAELRYRGAFHDLLQDNLGFEPSSELVMGDIRARSEFAPNRIYLERVDIVRIVSVPPLDAWSKKISWTATLGSRRLKDYACSGWACSAFHADAGGGLTLPLPALPASATLFASGTAQVGSVMERGFRTGIGPSGLLRFFWSHNIHTQVTAEKRYSFWGERVPWWALRGAQSFSWKQKHEILLEGEKLRDHNEVSLGYAYDF